jgi:hypothetical protein
MRCVSKRGRARRGLRSRRENRMQRQRDCNVGRRNNRRVRGGQY